jgi:periplasmic mercuric ion binding protein
MKKYFVFILLIISSFGALAQSKIVTSKIKVFGNCTQCKQRIETALEVKGIKTATWNSTSKELEVVYNKSKISERKIHEIVASVGHDTELVKANDSVYSDLPFCCLYRDHDHSNVKDELPKDHH